MLQVRENEISLLAHAEGTLLKMQCKWTFAKRFNFLRYKGNAPCYGSNHRKTLRWHWQQ